MYEQRSRVKARVQVELTDQISLKSQVLEDLDLEAFFLGPIYKRRNLYFCFDIPHVPRLCH